MNITNKDDSILDLVNNSLEDGIELKVTIKSNHGKFLITMNEMKKDIFYIINTYDIYASWNSDDWKESRIAHEKNIKQLKKLEELGVSHLIYHQDKCSAYPNGYEKVLIDNKE